MGDSIEVLRAAGVPLVDADGVPIREGSVLLNIKDGERGVVVTVVRPGGTYWGAGLPPCVGDIHIRLQPSVKRITNIYGEWRHVARADQTYTERLLSWQATPALEHDEFRGVRFIG